jgi:hypothetical protein
MSEYIVRELTQQEFETWDKLILSSPQGSIFLRSDFLSMICETDPSLHLTCLGCFNSEGELKAGQAVIYRRFMGLSIGFDSSFFYTGPVLPPALKKDRWSKAEKDRDYLTALANEMNRRYRDISWDTHPSMTDLRPFIRLGWKVSLHYTHTWNLTESRDIRNRISKGERQSVQIGQKNFTFQQEIWKEAGHEFIKVYNQAMTKQDWQPSDNWNRIFDRRVQWMEDNRLIMLTTARNPGNELGGGLLTIFSRDHQTAYIWKVGYDLNLSKTGIVPALYFSSVQALPPEITRVDMAEGMTLNQSKFKDYMGTDIQSYFVIASPNSRQQKIYKVRQLYRKVSGVLHSLLRRHDK